MASAKTFLSDVEKDAVVAAIREAELHTSGEIRVHIDDRCDQDAYDRALKVFQSLKMYKTPFRNAVLLYIAVKDKKFAIIGDEAIHMKVHPDFWNVLLQELKENFSNEHFMEGITRCVHTIGTTLSTHFPDIDQLDRNELPNDLSFE
ncbi:MAG: TPM domain-containing protein [Chitinophagales bacterium]